MARGSSCLDHFRLRMGSVFRIPLPLPRGMDSLANKARSMSAMLLIFYVIPAAGPLFSRTDEALRRERTMRKRSPHAPTGEILPRAGLERGAPLSPPRIERL
jgi:hypothetical protein